MKIKNKFFLIYGFVALILLLSIGVTYAWFNARIFGSNTPITATSKGINIVYTDDPEINATILPGYINTKQFTVENLTGSQQTYAIKWDDVTNNLENAEYLVYSLTSTDTGVNIVDQVMPVASTATDFLIVTNIPIANNALHTYTLTIKYYNTAFNQSSDVGRTFSGKIQVITDADIETTKFYEKILADNPNVSTRNTFNSVFTTSNGNNTIYSTSTNTEYNKTVYYFSGAVGNNYVKFGKNSSNNDLYWRIVRINEDNSVRLVYAGTSATGTSGYISPTVAFNSSNNGSIYNGYMYGTAGSLDDNRTNQNESLIKSTLDSWYNTNLNQSTYKDALGNKWDAYVSRSAIYCNDRSIGSGTYSTNTGNFKYGAYTRILTNGTPQFKCNHISDSFAGNNNYAYLEQPIGLLTADEYVYAGGYYNTSNSSAYLYQNANTNSLWTMSPWEGGASSYTATYGSSLYSSTSSMYPRPVISLKACVDYKSGTGLSSNPYEVEIDYSCASIDNNYDLIYTVLAQIDSSKGSVSPTTRNVSVGGNTTFNFTLTSPYIFKNIEGCDNTSYDEVSNVLTVSNIRRNQTCTLNAAAYYSIIASATYGTVVAPSSRIVEKGSNVEFSVMPNTNYEYDSLTGCTGASYDSGTQKLTITNVQSDQVCTVVFRQSYRTVNVSSTNSSYGTVSPANQTIASGENASITVTPATNYRYSSNTCGGTINGNTLTINNVTQNKTCTVTFVILPRTTIIANNATIAGGSTMTNMLINGSFENSSTGWDLSNATITSDEAYSGSKSLAFAPSVVAMSTQTVALNPSLPTYPTINHKYYGSLMFKSSTSYSAADSRFEWFVNDNAGGLLTYGSKTYTTNNWVRLSSVQNQTSSTYLTSSYTWNYRNFTVNANQTVYTDDLMMIDLTETFGSGNEPDKTWLDANINYFEDSASIVSNYSTSTTQTYTFTPAVGTEFDSISGCSGASYNTSTNVLTVSGITSDKTCQVNFIAYIYEFPYTGDVQLATLPAGTYKMEVWGAQGGTYSSTRVGGLGGYSVGDLALDTSTQLYVFVGGQGNYSSSTYLNGGWNGGGGVYKTTTYNSITTYKTSGGGATDIAFINGTVSLTNYTYVRPSSSYHSRLIVAGGGSGSSSRYSGWNGGGYIGNAYNSSYQATQIVPGGGAYPGLFGYAGYNQTTNYEYSGGGGGAGWYGGGSARCDSDSTCARYSGGGSGWVYTNASYTNWANNVTIETNWFEYSTAVADRHYLNESTAYTCDGAGACKNSSGTTYGSWVPSGTTGNGAGTTGQTGNGYAKITKIN